MGRHNIVDSIYYERYEVGHFLLKVYLFGTNNIKMKREVQLVNLAHKSQDILEWLFYFPMALKKLLVLNWTES